MKGFIEVTYIACDYALVKARIHYSQIIFKEDGSVKWHGKILNENQEEIKELIKNAQ